jgi:hypothetical protein
MACARYWEQAARRRWRWKRTSRAIRAMLASEDLTVIDGNDDFVSHQYTFAGLAEVIDQNAGQVCGALQMAKVRLLGESLPQQKLR